MEAIFDAFPELTGTWLAAGTFSEIYSPIYPAMALLPFTTPWPLMNCDGSAFQRI